MRLPGGAYDGDDPDGFCRATRSSRYLERYAGALARPCTRASRSTALAPAPGGGFALERPTGRWPRAHGRRLHRRLPARRTAPPAAARCPPACRSSASRTTPPPGALPPGAVLVVGSGQSGCQIAEELHAGRARVLLACGRAPWAPRRIGDRDLLWWPRERVPRRRRARPCRRPGRGSPRTSSPPATAAATTCTCARCTRSACGCSATSRGVEAAHARFAPDLRRASRGATSATRSCASCSRALVAAARAARARPARPRAAGRRRAASGSTSTGFGAVIVAAGFRPDYARWVHVPGRLRRRSASRVHAGRHAATAAPGLYFAGVHFLRKRKSSLLVGVGEDAAIVAGGIAAAALALGRRGLDHAEDLAHAADQQALVLDLDPHAGRAREDDVVAGLDRHLEVRQVRRPVAGGEHDALVGRHVAACPAGTSSPDRRMRSGSSSLMTTWSNSGRRTSGTGEPLHERGALARHARARDDEVEAGGVGAALGVGVDVRVDAERPRLAQLAVLAQALDDRDAVEARAPEVDDQHGRAVGAGLVGVAGQPRLVAGRAQHAEHVGAEQEVVEEGDDGALLRPQAAELLPHRLRAAPHLGRLDAAGAVVAQLQLAADAGLVEQRSVPCTAGAAAAWPNWWATRIRQCQSWLE